MIDIDNWMRELEEEEDIEIKNNEEYQTKLFEEYVLRGSDHQEERRKLNERYLSGEELMGEHGLRKELAAFEIPKSHIYKKFNIPKPENGEEVLKPPQAGMMTAQQQPMETTEELKLKQEEGQAEQRQVDTIVSIANKQSEDIFREMMKPIFKMIDKAEDMDELQKVLKDEKKLRELYQDMESPELEDLIQQGIYLSHLIGRSMD